MIYLNNHNMPKYLPKYAYVSNVLVIPTYILYYALNLYFN